MFQSLCICAVVVVIVMVCSNQSKWNKKKIYSSNLLYKKKLFTSSLSSSIMIVIRHTYQYVSKIHDVNIMTMMMIIIIDDNVGIVWYTMFFNKKTDNIYLEQEIFCFVLFVLFGQRLEIDLHWTTITTSYGLIWMDEYKKIDFHCLLTHQNDKAKKNAHE